MKTLILLFCLLISNNLFGEGNWTDSKIFHCKASDAFKIKTSEYNQTKFESIINKYSEMFSIEFKSRKETDSTTLIVYDKNGVSKTILTVLPNLIGSGSSKAQYESSLYVKGNIVAGNNAGSSFDLSLKKFTFKFYDTSIFGEKIIYGKCRN